MTTAAVEALERQAGWCDQLGSPFTARVCRSLARILDPGTATGRRMLGWGDVAAFERDAAVLRLTGGLHALVRRGDAPALAALYPPAPLPDDATLDTALADAIREHDAALDAFLDSAPQTNEVGRSGVLIGGLLTVAAETGLPLALHELGASAGLNLRLDAYAYDLGGLHVAPPDAPLTLAPAWDGPPPPAATLRVVRRRGVDLSPLDVTRAADRERLLAYVWPDQPARVERMARAVAAAALDPPPLDAGDAADWVEGVIAIAPEPGVARVVFHSIAFQYFPAVSRARIAAHLEAAGAAARADAPLAWLRYEVEGDFGKPPTLRLRLWPDGGDRRLAIAHPHGISLRWLG